MHCNENYQTCTLNSKSFGESTPHGICVPKSPLSVAKARNVTAADKKKVQSAALKVEMFMVH